MQRANGLQKRCVLLERTRPELGCLGASFTNAFSHAVNFPMYRGMCKPGALNPTGSDNEQRGSRGKQTTPMAPCQETRPLVGRFETSSTNALSPVVTFQCTGLVKAKQTVPSGFLLTRHSNSSDSQKRVDDSSDPRGVTS